MANPQANGITEWMHQVIANVIRTCKLKQFCVDEKDPWKGIISAAMCMVRSAHHATLQATPGQLSFGRDTEFNTKFITNWELIKE